MSLEGWQIGLLVGGVVLLLLVLVAVIVIVCMVCLRRRDDDEEDGNDMESKLTGEDAPASGIPNGGHAHRRGDGVSPASRNKKRGDGVTRNQKQTSAAGEDGVGVGQTGSPLLAGNPLYNPQEYLYNFDNPTYDSQRGVQYDACIRIQTAYRGYRERRKWSRVRQATVVIQKWVRGFLARRRTHKYRLAKSQQKLDAAASGRLKKQKSMRDGLLKGLALFDVKALGAVEVAKLHGEDTVADALRRMKKEHGVKGKSRMKISVSPHGLKLFDAASMTQLAHIRITSVSYCSVDSKTNKVFAFIHNLGDKGMCYGFHCINNNADQLAKTVAEAYHLVFKRLKKVQEKRQQQKTAAMLATRAAEEAKKLEADLDVHLEELESDFAELAALMNKGALSNLVNISNFGEEADGILAQSRSRQSLDTLDEDDDFNDRRSGSRFSLDDDLDDGDDDDDPFQQQLPADAVGFADLQDTFSKFEMAGLPAFDRAIEKFLQGDTSVLDYAQQRGMGMKF